MKKLYILIAMAAFFSGCSNAQLKQDYDSMFACITPVGAIQIPNSNYPEISARREGQDVLFISPDSTDVVPFNDCVEHRIPKQVAAPAVQQ